MVKAEPVKSPYGPCPDCGWGLVLDDHPDVKDRLDCSAPHCHFACQVDEAPRIMFGKEIQKLRMFSPPDGRIHRYLIVFFPEGSTGQAYSLRTGAGAVGLVKDIAHKRPGQAYEIWDLDGKVKILEGTIHGKA